MSKLDEPVAETKIIEPPWSPEQVSALNVWQKLGHVHPYTCFSNHGGDRVLVAHADGWRCPTCGGRHMFAYDYMADEARHPPPAFSAGVGLPSSTNK